MSCRLEFQNICKRYAGSAPVLRDLSLTVEPGELFFLLGPSGCGKSTLLRIAAGLIEPDSGRILADGKDIGALPPERRGMPMVFQSYALWPHMDVFENVAFGLKIRKLSASEIRTRVESILEAVQMTPYIRRKITALSGGQQQRVALARALVLDPSVLLLDEPLSNLDAKLRDAMRTEIRRICKEKKLTAVYVTHDRREALSMADRIAVLKSGQVRQCGTPREIYRMPRDRFTASFLGDVNFLTGRCLGREDTFCVFETEVGKLRATHGWGELPAPGETRTLMFRPESVRFDAAESDLNSFSAEIRESWFLGEITQTSLAAGSFVFTANEQDAPDRAHGTGLRVRVSPEHLVVLSPDPEED